MDVAITAYAVVMSQEGANHDLSANIAEGNTTLVSVRRRACNPDPPTQQVPDPPLLNPNAAPFESTATTVANETKTVLLQTAQAKMYNPSSTHLVYKLRVLLDSGSQRSYMT